MTTLNNTPDLSPDKMEQLLQLAGKKMGTDPRKLQQQLEQGAFDDAIRGLNQNQQAMFHQVLQDPKALEQLLSTPKAQQLLRTLMGGK